MKIVLTGSLGNIGKLLAPQLIAGGHELIIISSDPERGPEIEAPGRAQPSARCRTLIS